MKKIIFILLVALVLMGCNPFMRFEEIRVEVDGPTSVVLNVNHKTYFDEMPPISVIEYVDVNNLGFGRSSYAHYFVTCFSEQDFTINIYENDVLQHSEVTNYIIYEKR